MDRSHRKLAHRGSYEGRVFVSPSTVDRVLARNGLALPGDPRPARTVKQPWPAWCEWRPNQLWCWDGSQFEACKASKYAYGIIDLVSRKWIATTLTPEPTSASARVLFLKALDAAQLLTDQMRDRLSDLDGDLPEGEEDGIPLLLAISDNGTEMKASDTRKFMALCSIAQHFGRPGTPTDCRKHVLGVWLGDGGEGAKFWLSVLTELRHRGVEDVLLVCCDGLKGLPDAIEASYPTT